MSEPRSASLRDIATVLFRYRKRIALVIGISVVVAGSYLLFSSPVYEAESKILILLGREKFVAMEALKKEEAHVVFRERGENITNEIEIIRDKELIISALPTLKRYLEQYDRDPVTVMETIKYGLRRFARGLKAALRGTAQMLGLVPRLTDDDQLILRVQNSLNVEFLELTDVMRLTYRDPNPQFAAAALNELIEQYFQRRAAILQSGESKDFYEEQIALYADKLKESESALEKFRLEGEISTLDVQRDILLNEISGRETKYNDLTLEYEETKIVRNVVNDTFRNSNRWIETPEIGSVAIDYAALDKHYFDLLADRNRLLDKYSPASREVGAVDFQIQKLREEKARNLLGFLDTRMNTISQRRELLSREIRQKRTQLGQLDRSELKLRELERLRELTETNYLAYKRKAEDLRISQDLAREKFTSVRVISYAVPPSVPVGPKPALVLSVAAFLGVFLGFGYAVVAQYFNHTFQRADEVRRILDVPLLATFSEFSNGANALNGRKR